MWLGGLSRLAGVGLRGVPGRQNLSAGAARTRLQLGRACIWVTDGEQGTGGGCSAIFPVGASVCSNAVYRAVLPRLHK